LVPVLSPAECERWDSLAESAGTARATLMECAGRATAALITDRFSIDIAKGVLVAAGTGNNGGDGWVLARALHRAGVAVWVAPLAGAQSPLCKAAAERALGEGVRQLAPDGPWPAMGLVIDALLGTGARGAPRAPVAALAERIAELRVPLVAIDGPTGLDLGTGVVHAAPKADVTVTFGGVRRGHLLARDETGRLIVVDIGHPPPAPEWPRLVDDGWAARHVPAFTAATHKGERGRVVLLGGAPGMSGAIRLAARSALAAGAGYAHVVAPAGTLAELRLAEPEVLTLEHALEEPVSDALATLVRSADVLVIGPGLGRSAGAAGFVSSVVAHARRAVVDADALTVFAGDVAALAGLAESTQVVVTPHPGEFRTLFPELAAEREVNPWGAAMAAADRLRATVLLKGIPTVVASPRVRSLTIASGNPGLGTGGSGDVLSGLLATVLAQSGEPSVAAGVAAHVLGRAADLAARRHTVRAVRPADVIAAIPDVWREWSRRRGAGLSPRLAILAELPAPILS